MMKSSKSLKLSVSTLSLAAVASLVATSALAQSAANSAGPSIEEVVVTGTNIRGASPVGSNLVSIGIEQIEKTSAVTVQQMLKLDPAITNFGGAGSANVNAPTIHSLGSSGSNSTLVIVDGHRMPQGGTSHVAPDPAMVPSIAVGHVDVLAEGASSVYGSDATAGVVNVVTRSGYEGFEANVQELQGSDYGTQSMGILFGHSWGSGSVLAAYGYNRTSNQTANYQHRPYSYPDHRPYGGTNLLTFNTDPATVQPGGTGNIFLSETTGVNVANTTANAPFLPLNPNNRVGSGADERNTVFLKVVQDIGSNLTITNDVDFSYHDTYSHTSAGTLTATAFKTGAQANPFYQTPVGYTGTATTETIRWDATGLLGVSGLNDQNLEDWYDTLHAEYRLGDNFRINALAMMAQDDTFVNSNGSLNTSVATLALNGTTSTAGSTTVTSIPGQQTVITNLPLTTLNALDVWNPAATNKTSAAVIKSLTDNWSSQRSKQQINQFRLTTDGTLMTLDSGDVKVAAGVEYVHYLLDDWLAQPTNDGPSSTSESFTYYPGTRSVASFFGELNIPVIGPDMGIFLIKKLQVDLAGRYDTYNDVGSTGNPKIGLDWTVMDGLKFRANWSTSFVAPSERSTGDVGNNGLNSLSRATLMTTSATVSTAAFPNIIGIPGCNPGAVTCTIGSNTPGIYRYTGAPGTQPEKGLNWNIGADYAPDFIPGLDLSVTFFYNKLNGGITSPLLSAILTIPSLNHLLTFCPTGCTNTQIANFIGNAPIRTALAPISYYLFDQRQTNFFNLYLEGLDIEAHYDYPTDNWGTFSVGVISSDFTQFDQQFSGGTVFSVLNTTGFNTTFPSIATQGRANFGWAYQGLNVDFFVNYVGSYHNWSSNSILPITQNAAGNPIGGGDKVYSNTTLDAHVSYDLMNLGLTYLGNSQVYVDGRNLMNSSPPFYNGNAGYDNVSSNTQGRVLSVGLRLKY